MQYQKSKIWHKNVLPGTSHLHFNLVLCIFRVSHLALFNARFSQDNRGRVSRPSRRLYLTPCILLTSHLTFFHSILLHLSFLISYFLCHIMWHMSISMTYVIDIFIDTYDIWHIWLIWHMCYILYDTYVIDIFIDICHMSTSKSHAWGGTRYIPG